jgi:hypothetical protein
VNRFELWDRPAYAARVFRSKGWSKVAAVAIVGNLQQEAYFNLRPDATGYSSVDSGKQSIGLAQWQGVRKDKFLWFCKNLKLPPTDFDANLAFVDWELNNTERSAGKALRNAQTIYSACRAMIGYERPVGWSVLYPQGGSGWDKRLQNAINLDQAMDAMGLWNVS